jgi:hypothetical protein
LWFYMKYIVKNYSDRILLARLCTYFPWCTRLWSYWLKRSCPVGIRCFFLLWIYLDSCIPIIVVWTISYVYSQYGFAIPCWGANRKSPFFCRPLCVIDSVDTLEHFLENNCKVLLFAHDKVYQLLAHGRWFYGFFHH